MRKKLFAAVLTVALVFSFLTVNVGALDLNKYNVDSYEAPTYFSDDAMQGVGEIWKYEYSSGYNADFKDMTKKLGLYVSADEEDFTQAAALASPWSTDLYLFPGWKNGASLNAVQVFVAPKSGFATVRACDVIRHYGMKDKGEEAKQDCEIAVYLNDKKIWPESGGWAKISAEKVGAQPAENTYSVPELKELKVNAGDKIRFAVGCGTASYANWNDYVKWYCVVDLYTEKSAAEISSVSSEAQSTVSTDTSSEAVSSDTESDAASQDTTSDVSSDEEKDKNNAMPVWAIILLIVVVLCAAASGIMLFLAYKKTNAATGEKTAEQAAEKGEDEETDKNK